MLQIAAVRESIGSNKDVWKEIWDMEEGVTPVQSYEYEESEGYVWSDQYGYSETI